MEQLLTVKKKEVKTQFLTQNILNDMRNLEMNVMLVDDDEASHIIHRINMEDAGLNLDKVSSFYNVDEAISSLQSMIKNNEGNNWPDYILLDINMPKKTGYDFIDEFEQMKLDFEIPTIYFVSSSVNPNDVTRAKEIELIQGFKSKFMDKEFFKSLAGV